MSSTPGTTMTRGWIGFGRNYFHTLGAERWHDLPPDSHKDELYSWGLTDEGAVDSVIEAYQYTKEIPDKRKREKSDNNNDQLVPAACSSACSFFLSGARHNRIMMLGTIHGHVMNPILEEQQFKNNQNWSPFDMVSPSTVTIPLPLPCVELAAGRHFCLARLEGGLAVCSWGAGHFGQLGHGTTSFSSGGEVGAGGIPDDVTSTSTYQATPKVIERLLPRMIGCPIAQVAAGDWHAMALTQEGTVLAWGCNRNMQCGRKSTRANKNPNAPSAAPLQMIPMPITILDSDPDRIDEPPVQIAKIVCGKAHSVAISRQNQVYCWGASHYGQCASNSGNSIRTSKYTRNTTALPRLVNALQDCQVIDVAAGDRHTLALTHGGRVFSWGAGGEGQLAIFPPIVATPKPRLIQDLDFVAIAASEMQAQARILAIAAADPNNHNVQNDATTKAQFEAEAAHTLASIPTITSVHAAGCSSFALSSNGHVYAWGCNDAKNLGLPVPPTNSLPYWEMGMTPAPPNNQRLLEVRTFDSQHNVLLPRRLESLMNVNVEQCIMGPSHSWFVGDARPPTDRGAKNGSSGAIVVGRTLYEVEQSRKAGMDGSRVHHNNGGSGNTASSLHTNSSWADSAATSELGGSSLTNTNNSTTRRPLISQSSTMPTDDEDNTGVDLMSASMPALPTEQEAATTGHSVARRNSGGDERRARYGRRHSDTDAAVAGTPGGSKSRQFSLSNLLRKLGVSNKKNNSSASAPPENDIDRSSNHDKDKRMSNSSSGKSRFRLRSNNS
ncbi:RCC1 and BTB domain-containing protein 2 [Seminavis robusta]|uniref:RCC1 and BTB domain-containing protein 2 n=1 Tax=Seminavis robusta TaxID=568900 RepID=A0A9N8EY19_9STRA|nr:RCC1 and BTB domain-containing protein 2 [Seminavis robusta]|eukprot:Sro2476_g328790.1 RCC1 and BTB domain-containing protein 2 (779) ;mRNA; r:10507-12843